ncbi:phage tail protein [Neolewinella antarctica]|uniref:Microcystin-dependent protein n=1 Tax=Neolewinella antarctica TaxID=442734 RepID=A0ABX0XDL6_9BACT|nr:tail fiber protein [Neolewinella antarctica]NJC26852.1 microcystin-dependent protein [Neolewinella antarctica]
MSITTGEILLVAFNYAPRDFALCQGQLLSISGNTQLFSLLGTTFGGDGRTTFALPDLSGRGPVSRGGNFGGRTTELGDAYGTGTASLNGQLPQHTHGGEVVLGSPAANLSSGKDAYLSTKPAGELYTKSTVGAGLNATSVRSDRTGVENLQPFQFSSQEPSLALNYCIALSGTHPTTEPEPDVETSEIKLDDVTTYIGTVQFFANNFVPRGYLPCAGQLLAVSNYQTLFQLIGTLYGSDGPNTFALPDLRGCYPLGASGTEAAKGRPLASREGQPTFTMTADHLPAHSHAGTMLLGGGRNVLPTADDNYLDGSSLPGVYRPEAGQEVLGASGSVTMDTAGGGQPFSLQSPYLGLTAAIAVSGEYPPHN